MCGQAETWETIAVSAQSPIPDPDIGKFRELTGAFTSAVRLVTNAARSDRESARNAPTKGSPAHSEQGLGGQVAGPDGTPVEVIDMVHFLNGNAMSAGESHLRAWATLAESLDETFIWSAPIMLRGALESLGMVAHLSDSDAPVTVRRARMMNELLEAAWREDKLTPPGTPSRETARVLEAQRLGLQQFGKSPRVFEESRPSQTSLVDGMFTSKIARHPYAYLSAFAHGTPAMALGTRHRPGRRSPATGLEIPFELTAADIAFQALLGYAGHRVAFTALSQWCGWSTPEYAIASSRAVAALAPLIALTDESFEE